MVFSGANHLFSWIGSVVMQGSQLVPDIIFVIKAVRLGGHSLSKNWTVGVRPRLTRKLYMVVKALASSLSSLLLRHSVRMPFVSWM